MLILSAAAVHHLSSHEIIYNISKPLPEDGILHNVDSTFLGVKLERLCYYIMFTNHEDDRSPKRVVGDLSF